MIIYWCEEHRAEGSPDACGIFSVMEGDPEVDCRMVEKVLVDPESWRLRSDFLVIPTADDVSYNLNSLLDEYVNAFGNDGHFAPVIAAARAYRGLSLRLKAEWYRNGMHDIAQTSTQNGVPRLTDDEIRERVAGFSSQFFDALRALTDLGPPVHRTTAGGEVL